MWKRWGAAADDHRRGSRALAAPAEAIRTIPRAYRRIAWPAAVVPNRTGFWLRAGVSARRAGQLHPVSGAGRDLHDDSFHGHLQRYRIDLGPPVWISEGNARGARLPPDDHDWQDAWRGHGLADSGRDRGGDLSHRGLPSERACRPRRSGRVRGAR